MLDQSELLGRKVISSITPTIFTCSVLVTMADKDEPEEAHGIAPKIKSPEAGHILYPNAAPIETAVGKCKTALQQQTDATTALTISKITLVRKYNANYFIIAGDLDKNFAEKLFPKLYLPK